MESYLQMNPKLTTLDPLETHWTHKTGSLGLILILYSMHIQCATTFNSDHVQKQLSVADLQHK